MRYLLFIFSMAGILYGSTYFIFQPNKVYTVRITFCDNRPAKTVRVYGAHAPTTDDIQNGFNHRVAVPEWRGYLNVCELETIKTEDK